MLFAYHSFQSHGIVICAISFHLVTVRISRATVEIYLTVTRSGALKGQYYNVCTDVRTHVCRSGASRAAHFADETFFTTMRSVPGGTRAFYNGVTRNGMRTVLLSVLCFQNEDCNERAEPCTTQRCESGGMAYSVL